MASQSTACSRLGSVAGLEDPAAMRPRGSSSAPTGGLADALWSSMLDTAPSGSTIEPPPPPPPVGNIPSAQLDALILAIGGLVAQQQQHMSVLQQQAAAVAASAAVVTASPAPLSLPVPPWQTQSTPMAAAGAPADTVMADPFADLVSSINGKAKLPASVTAKINAVAAKLKKSVHSWKVAERHLEKLKERLTVLRAGRIPAGVQPHKLPFMSEVWVEAPGESLLSDLDCEQLRDCTTLDSVRAKLHVLFLCSTTAVDISAQQRRVDLLQKHCDFNTFVEACLAEVTHELDVLQKHTTGISVPPGLLGRHHEAAKIFSGRLYRDIITAEAKSIEATSLAEEKAKSKQAKALEEAAKLKPEQVLEKAFDNYLVKLGKGRGASKKGEPRVDYAKMINVPITAPTIVEPASPSTSRPTRPSPKNGAAPSSGRGNFRKPAEGKGFGSGAKSKKGKTVKAWWASAPPGAAPNRKNSGRGGQGRGF